jgi:hypothetical protein
LRLLILIASQFGIVYYCLHIPSKENFHADFLSRYFVFSSFVQFCRRHDPLGFPASGPPPTEISFQPLPVEDWKI